MNLSNILSVARPVAEEISKRYGVTGTAAGISVDGKQAYLNIGTRGSDGVAPDRDTIFPIASVSKTIAGVALGCLVACRQLHWESPVEEFVFGLNIGLRHRENDKLRVRHLMDHDTEFFRCDVLWEGVNGRVNIKDFDDVASLYQHLPPNPKFEKLSDFKNTRNYVNLTFIIIQKLIESVTGGRWQDYIWARVFHPLGMDRTFYDLEELDQQTNVAGSYCTKIDGDRYCHLTDKDSIFDEILANVRLRHPVAVSQSVGRTQCQDLPAGLRSSVSDLLKFYDLFQKIWITGIAPEGELAQLGSGILACQTYIKGRIESDQACAYACGWGIGREPYTSPQRPTGADGDNYRRFAALQERGILSCADYGRLLDVSSSSSKQDIILNHCGNMTGSTAFVAVGRMIVVVLCNTRGRYVDAANLIGMTLIQCLHHELSVAEVGKVFQRCLKLAEYSAAQYEVEVADYEHRLRTEYPSIAQYKRYKHCVGTYTLRGNLSIKLLKGGNRLKFQPPWEKKKYVLRVKASSTPEEISMTFALPIAESHKAGLGGSNWMDMPRFSLVFREPMDGQMDRATWTFAGVPEQEREFSFIRCSP
jgi:CubicO group peptidase (beta-lactamase class C family)